MAESKTSASRPRKRFVGSSSTLPSGIRPTLSNRIPDEILHDEHLNLAIGHLPPNYSFEIHKTIYHIRKNKAIMVALQMPEGLQMFACTVADIIEQFTNALTVILGDVTYGACCVDDYTAIGLGCDMLIHYGHSCLVPIDQTRIKTLYVFVEISIDSVHLEQTVRFNLPSDRQSFCELLLSNDSDAHLPAGSQLGHLQIEGPSKTEQHDGTDTGPTAVPKPTRLALVSTIQFVTALQRLKEDLTVDMIVPNSPSTGPLPRISSMPPPAVPEPLTGKREFWAGKYDVTVPRSKPLSPGEILGCTAPRLGNVDAILYLGDGRFHLESIMIANPTVPAFRYDPYIKKMTRERYNHLEMQAIRNDAVECARKDIISSMRHVVATDAGGEPRQVWGVILGTLGRQGNLKQLEAIINHLKSPQGMIPYMQILLSEISPAKLSLFNPYISTFVQTSCPRLSIDWGYAFDRPLLSPYETAVAVGAASGWMSEGTKEVGDYPMDFYAGGSPWAAARLTASI
ncbi:hypothetical protein AX15_001290 [Amanita polypyramis BW_CC]|nr:hypothetical protein AX15_001290 [Amanita polypyramis BW_CC]